MYANVYKVTPKDLIPCELTRPSLYLRTDTGHLICVYQSNILNINTIKVDYVDWSCRRNLNTKLSVHFSADSSLVPCNLGPTPQINPLHNLTKATL